MALTIFTPPQEPNIGSTKTTNTRILRADFGDGYSQRAGDGLNAIKLTLNLSWSALPVADADTIEDFLTARAGYEAFKYTKPRGTEKKYICVEWNREYSYPNHDKITAVFEEVFDHG